MSSGSRKRKRKRKPASRPDGLERLMVFLQGPGRPLVLSLMVAVLLAGVWYAVWANVRDHVFASDQYLIGPHDVQITSLPEWIRTDIRTDVFRNASLGGQLSLLDDDLTERIHNAFCFSPWVAKVVSVRKRSGRVEVELVYRRPVCMVKVSGSDDLLPVDAYGVLLPSGRLSSVEKSRYPLLVGINSLPLGTVGECWGDPRVVGGAEIAAVLCDVWKEWNLREIEPSGPLVPGVAEEHIYTLVTRGNTRINWRRAPGSKAPGELPASEKVARLEAYLTERGTLEGDRGPQELDVHFLRLTPQHKR